VFYFGQREKRVKSFAGHYHQHRKSGMEWQYQDLCTHTTMRTRYDIFMQIQGISLLFVYFMLVHKYISLGTKHYIMCMSTTGEYSLSHGTYIKSGNLFSLSFFFLPALLIAVLRECCFLTP